MEPVTITKTVFRRDTKTYEFILKRDGSPINLTSYTPYLSAKKKLDGTELFSKECTVTVAAVHLQAPVFQAVAAVLFQSR